MNRCSEQTACHTDVILFGLSRSTDTVYHTRRFRTENAQRRDALQPEISNIRGSPGGKHCAIVHSGKKSPALQRNAFSTITVSSQTEYLQVIWMNSGFLRRYADVLSSASPTKQNILLFWKKKKTPD